MKKRIATNERNSKNAISTKVKNTNSATEAPIYLNPSFDIG
jgi:hypothetical protein